MNFLKFVYTSMFSVHKHRILTDIIILSLGVLSFIFTKKCNCFNKNIIREISIVPRNILCNM